MTETRSNGRQGLFSVLMIIASFIAVAALIYFNIHAWGQAKKEKQRFADLELRRQQQVKTIEHLAELKSRQEQIQSEMQLMKRRVKSMLRVCRNRDDFFTVFGDEIVSSLKVEWGYIHLLLAVPQVGTHRMRIVITQGSSGAEQDDLYRKTITLDPSRKHELEFKMIRDAKEQGPPKQTTLKINNEALVQLPNPPFDPSSYGETSTGFAGPFRRPNQIESYVADDRTNEIANVYFAGKGNEQVSISIYLESDGPKQSAADNSRTVNDLIGRLMWKDTLVDTNYDPRGWYTFQ